METSSQKIVPHLWFDKEAKEAAEFHVSVFGEDSEITSYKTLHDTPDGGADVVGFKLWGYQFMSISAGPYFKINPSISFLVNFDPAQDSNAKARIDEIWEKLSDGGTVRMPLDAYPFSERYGWIEDKYGVNWQLMLTNPDGEMRPRIIPALTFVGDVCGKAEEATDYYISVFKDASFDRIGESKRGQLVRWPAGMEPDKEGTIMFTDFMLSGQWFMAMDSAHEHNFAFNEAVSLMVNCDSQEEIDYFWEKLSAVPESEQCGWLKDKFGVSWQITPTRLEEMMASDDSEAVKRATQAFLKMKKFDLAELEKAFAGA